MTNLRIDALVFISRFPWIVLGYGSSYATSFPKLGQAYVTWNGESYLALQMAVVHELCEILSYSRDAGRPLVVDCKHHSCLMNPKLAYCSMRLHEAHLNVLDRDQDGSIDCKDLDRNGDNRLDISVVISKRPPASTVKILKKIRNGMIEVLGLTNGSTLRVRSVQLHTLLSSTLDARYYD